MVFDFIFLYVDNAHTHTHYKSFSSSLRNRIFRASIAKRECRNAEGTEADLQESFYSSIVENTRRKRTKNDLVSLLISFIHLIAK